MCKEIEAKQSLFFREEFRNARSKALENAEGFQEILFAIEKLGFYLNYQEGNLGVYRLCISRLAKKSDLFSETAFDNLYKIVKDARNDALHQGAFARHLTQNAIRLALILEDALEKVLGDGKLKVEDFMVSNVVCGDLWKPLAFIRQQMLANSFSYLPFSDEEKGWFLISDFRLANYLRSPNIEISRKKRLSELLKDVYTSLEVEKAEVISEGTDIFDALKISNGKPILIAKDNKSTSLSGIITPFDLL